MNWWKEIRKQMLDQPLHFMWAFATVFPFAYWAFHNPPMVFVVTFLWLIVNGVWIVAREIDQWPSSRPWDPWMDWAFFAGGAVYAAYLGVQLHHG